MSTSNDSTGWDRTRLHDLNGAGGPVGGGTEYRRVTSRAGWGGAR